MRPVMETKAPAMEYPSQTQIHDCHHDSLSAVIMDEAIIHVLTLKESAVKCFSLKILEYGWDVDILTNPEGDKVPS